MTSSNSIDINGNKIRQIREQKGLTQLYLATVVGVTTDTISRWENRRYPSIKPENARKLAEALEVTIEDLLEQTAGAEEPLLNTPTVEPPAPDATVAKSPMAQRLRAWAGRYRLRLGIGLGAVVLLATGGVVLFNSSGIRAVRIMPAHTAPSLPFPVLIQVEGPVEAVNTLILREELTGDCEASGISADDSVRQFSKNPRWIGRLDNGKAAFVYLVTPGRKLHTDESLQVTGDLVAEDGRNAEVTVGGPHEITLTPYHWADTDQDYVISDAEIRKAYATYQVPGAEHLIDFRSLEELWMAGRYTWNKKTQTIVPVPGEAKTPPPSR